jgi:hypothetical protein
MVELLVASSMAIVVIGAASLLLIVAVRTQPRISERDAAIQQGRVLEERFVRELRQTYKVEAGASSQTISFDTYMRRVQCGSTQAPASTAPAIPCRVSYVCTAGSCTRSERNADGTGIPLVQTAVAGLSSSAVFGYSPSTANPDYVTVRLVFPATGGDDAVTLDDGVELRNK